MTIAIVYGPLPGRLAAGHAALDRGTVVRIHPGQFSAASCNGPPVGLGWTHDRSRCPSGDYCEHLFVSGRECTNDWEAIRSFYETGKTMRECQERFGFSNGAWHHAVQRGQIFRTNRTKPQAQGRDPRSRGAATGRGFVSSPDRRAAGSVAADGLLSRPPTGVSAQVEPCAPIRLERNTSLLRSRPLVSRMSESLRVQSQRLGRRRPPRGHCAPSPLGAARRRARRW